MWTCAGVCRKWAWMVSRRTPGSIAGSGSTRPSPSSFVCSVIWERLGVYAGEKRIVILLDGLNQLDDGHDLGWLPYQLGPGVRIVVSCIEESTVDSENPQGDIQSEETRSAGSMNLREKLSSEHNPALKVLAALGSRHLKPKRISLGPLNSEDVHIIVTSYLKEYCKELDAPHVDVLCALPQARNPLYLLVMLSELCTLGGNDMNRVVPGLIASMAAKHPDTVSLFAWALRRMETAEGFGKKAVQAWCLYLALGRVGMSSRELSDLLVHKLGPDSAATAQRIERALRRYLLRRGETLDLFHGQLRQAVMESYGKEGKDIAHAHRESAAYFLSLADPSHDKIWMGEHQRPFQEIAFHLIGSGEEDDWDELCAYLTDFRCLDVRIRAGQVFEVVKDNAAAIAALPEFAADAERESERVEICRQYGDALVAYSHECASREDPPFPKPPAVTYSGECTVSPYGRRAASLKAIACFLNRTATVLSEGTDQFLIMAANAASSGPLMRACSELDGKGLPWLQRCPRPPGPLLRSQCLAVLYGHSVGVWGCVSVSYDGRRAISAGGRDRTLRVWDLENGQCLAILQGHTKGVYGVSLSADGRRAVSAGEDKTLMVWDLASNQCLAVLRGHTTLVESVSLTPDGRRAISTGWGDNTMRVWNLESYMCLVTIQLDLVFPVVSVTAMPDGRRVIAGSSFDGTLLLWDVETGHSATIIPEPRDNSFEGVILNHSRRTVSVTPDGRRAISAGWNDHALRVWDLEDRKCLAVLHGHSSEVHGVSLTPNGCRAISASEDKTLRVWDLERGQCLAVLRGHTAPVRSVSLSADGARAVSGGLDGTLRLWDLKSGDSPFLFPGHSSMIRGFVFTPNGKCVVSFCNPSTYFFEEDFSLRVWDLKSGRCHAVLEGHSNSVSSVNIASDSRWAVSASNDATLRVWDLESGECLELLEGGTAGIDCVELTSDGAMAVSGSSDGTVRVWNLTNGQCIFTLQGHTFRVESVKVHPNSRCAVSQSGEDFRVWDLVTGECMAKFTGCLDGFGAVSITPDGHRAVCEIDGSGLQFFDVASGQYTTALSNHDSKVRRVSITPDGRFAVSSDDEGTIRKWDMNSGRCLALFCETALHVDAIRLSPDGRRAVVADEDGSLCVWDLEDGDKKVCLHGHTSFVDNVRFTSDGRHAVSQGGTGWRKHDKTCRFWELETGKCLALLESQKSDCIRFIPNWGAICGGWDQVLRVVNFTTGQCSPIYNAGSPVSCIDLAPNRDGIVCGTWDGQMHFLAMKNFPPLA